MQKVFEFSRQSPALPVRVPHVTARFPYSCIGSKLAVARGDRISFFSIQPNVRYLHEEMRFLSKAQRLCGRCHSSRRRPRGQLAVFCDAGTSRLSSVASSPFQIFLVREKGNWGSWWRPFWNECIALCSLTVTTFAVSIFLFFDDSVEI